MYNKRFQFYLEKSGIRLSQEQIQQYINQYVQSNKCFTIITDSNDDIQFISIGEDNPHFDEDITALPAHTLVDYEYKSLVNYVKQQRMH